MSGYRFCRTDDIGLLVDALNHCGAPDVDEPPVTPAAFKRSIRDLQVWCSSCMVAFSGSEPVGVLIGAKRPSGTLVHWIAVHPDHRRQGHARHMLASLGSKLAILGPPRIVAEVPEALAPACELFRACGFVEEAVLTDYVLEAGPSTRAEGRHPLPFDPTPGSPGEVGRLPAGDEGGDFLIPVTVGDLEANGLLGAKDPEVCWSRSVETLAARQDGIAGLAVASNESIEACILYMRCGERAEGTAEIVALRSFSEDGGTRLKLLLSQVAARGMHSLRFAKVHPAEVSKELLETLGFRPAGGHRRYAARAQSD